MNKYREEFEKKGNYQSKYNRKYGWSYYYRGQKIKEHNYWRAFSKWLESQLEQAEKEKKELVEFVKNKINGCDELTGMEREKWAFQQVLNQIEL